MDRCCKDKCCPDKCQRDSWICSRSGNTAQLSWGLSLAKIIHTQQPHLHLQQSILCGTFLTFIFQFAWTRLNFNTWILSGMRAASPGTERFSLSITRSSKAFGVNSNIVLATFLTFLLKTYRNLQKLHQAVLALPTTNYRGVHTTWACLVPFWHSGFSCSILYW